VRRSSWTSLGDRDHGLAEGQTVALADVYGDEPVPPDDRRRRDLEARAEETDDLADEGVQDVGAVRASLRVLKPNTV
jgi:hypothetical protein